MSHDDVNEIDRSRFFTTMTIKSFCGQSPKRVATMRASQLFLNTWLLITCYANGFLIRHDQNRVVIPKCVVVGCPTTTTALNMATELPSRQKVAEGMDRFRRGDIQGSIESFDSSVSSGSQAYLWQRGISYYYANDFAKGSQQFRDDVLRSPLDVEEIVWDIACLLRIDPTFPPPNMMSLPPGKTDRRPIMATVYSLFRGEASEQDLAQAGHGGGPGEEFYALFYLGLFSEARGETSKAENYMRSAIKTKYAKAVGSQDYMVDVAKVHCQLRHWV